MKKFIFSIVFFMAILQIGEGQSLRRATITSIGSSNTSNDIRLSSSFGQQCSGCTVLKSPDGFGYARQGFQQPPDESSDLPPCNFSSEIAIEPMETPCGTYFNFEYLGLADPLVTEFHWDFGNVGVPTSSNEQNPSNIAFGATGYMVVGLTLTVPGECSESMASVFEVNDIAFTALPNETGNNCFGEENGTIALGLMGGTGPYAVEWADFSDASLEQSNLASGSYAFTVSDSDGCIFESEAIIPGPSEELTITQSSLLPETCTDTNDGHIFIDVNGGTPPYSINWSNQSNTLSAENLTKGNYSVEVTDQNGCQAQANFEILNYCEDGENILYDIITPNNDGVNDFWVITGIENFPENKVEIHNRWGNIIWENNSYVNASGSAFEGKDNSGNDLPAGAYYYVVQFNNADKTTLGGSLTIVR